MVEQLQGLWLTSSAVALVEARQKTGPRTAGVNVKVEKKDPPEFVPRIDPDLRSVLGPCAALVPAVGW